nr:MAG TPA: hypothetical protein [Caudoviricetes sp.]
MAPRSFHRACRWVQLPYLLLSRYFGIFFYWIKRRCSSGTRS